MNNITDKLLEKESIQLIRSGNRKALEELYEQIHRQYPVDFPSFIAQMIQEYKTKRKDAIARSCLSADYAYKLMNGNKTTKERDYIIAICMGVGISLAQTQHALDICGIPKLNARDIRDILISESIKNHDNIHKLNGVLERVDLELLKVSPEMPTAKTHIYDQMPVEVKEKFKEIDSSVTAEKSGEAPMDFAYFGEIILENQDGKRYYVQADFNDAGSAFRVFDEEQKKRFDEEANAECHFFTGEMTKEQEADVLKRMQEYLEQSPTGEQPTEEDEEFDEDEDDEYESEFMLETGYALEEYPSLVAASESKFFKYFYRLDDMIDEKSRETLEKIDDTAKLDNKFRIGMGWFQGVERVYCEAAMETEDKGTVYLQVVREDGKYKYSASMESVFLLYEMNDLYEVYFNRKRKPSFFIETDAANKVMGRNPYFVFLFNQMQIDMDGAAGQYYKTPFDANESKIRCLFQQVVALYNLNMLDKSIEIINELLEFIDSCKDGINRTAEKISALEKLSMTYLELNKQKESDNALKAIFELRDDLPPLDDDSNFAYICLLDAISRLSLQAQIKGDDGLMKMYMDVAIPLADKVDYEKSGDWVTAFTLNGRLATYYEEIDVEKSIHYYLEAFAIAEDHNLVERLAGQLSVLYNNYGWVLWNKCDSLEAISPYLRCLDLLEAIGRKGKKNKDNYRHTVEAILKIYESGNMTKEADRLRARLKKYEKS